MKTGKKNFKNNIGWSFDNTYAALPEAMFSKHLPDPVKSPKLVILNKELSKKLNLNFSSVSSEKLAAMFAGNLLPEGSESIAQAYAGHQFGNFTMLGDGRAIIIGEHITKNNERFDIQFKGSGLTPYSRNADGRAALSPMLREYIISEAMHGLNIPTTRSLAVVTTGENIIRETTLPGAILTRVASSHIRVGTFQYVSAQNDKELLKTLLDYSIERHYPNIKGKNNSAIELLTAVIKKQIDLVTNWMRVGFIHGVMNTDNMTISGETIDYGPCAYMDSYDPETVFSSIDLQGRYAYFNQPGITKWNISRFAETLLPLIDQNKNKAIKIATEVVNSFDSIYENSWLIMMKNKLGLIGEHKGDEKLIIHLLSWMKKNKADYTNTFCYLMKEYQPKEKIFKNKEFIDWYERYIVRVGKGNDLNEESYKLMRKNNPLVIPRNHEVEKVLAIASNEGVLKPLYNLLNYLKKPYENQEGIINFQNVHKTNGKTYKTFCGT